MINGYENEFHLQNFSLFFLLGILWFYDMEM